MGTISVQDLQRDIMGALRRVESGEFLLVLNGVQVMAELHPAHSGATDPRPFGRAAGEFLVPADFDDPLPESTIEEFEGG